MMYPDDEHSNSACYKGVHLYPLDSRPTPLLFTNKGYRHRMSYLIQLFIELQFRRGRIELSQVVPLLFLFCFLFRPKIGLI